MLADTLFVSDLARPATIEGQLVYAIGDIHGRYDLLKDLLARIAEDCEGRANGRRPILIFCGDYIDRGPDSSKVLSAIVWLKRHSAFEVHVLKGNHEAAFLSFLADPRDGIDWLDFGGGETLFSYGVTPPAEPLVGTTLRRARDDLLDRMPVAHLRLLESLELMVSLGDYAFVHAGVRPGVGLADQVENDLLWIREPFLTSGHSFGKVVVHGHSWKSDRPAIHDNRIGIDTGAYQTGVLTALRIQDGAIAPLQVTRAF